MLREARRGASQLKGCKDMMRSMIVEPLLIEEDVVGVVVAV
jgi:hypothetical protein